MCLGLRQETPHCASVSFDRHAANVFQQYILGALAFSIKRGGILYGTVDEEGNVLAHAIYEPPQASLFPLARLFEVRRPSTCYMPQARLWNVC